MENTNHFLNSIIKTKKESIAIKIKYLASSIVNLGLKMNLQSQTKQYSLNKHPLIIIRFITMS